METEQELFDFIGRPGSIVDYLNSQSFDELVEMDLANNRIKNLFHVEGKYFIPVFDGSFKDLYKYSSNNMIHPDDVAVHQDFMNHDTLLERLKNSKIPGVISAEFRYRLQSGGWCWVRQVVLGGAQHGLADGIIRFYVFDIQNRKQRELGNAVIGQHDGALARDALTGLRREKEFFAEARTFVMHHEAGAWCLIALDIDQFKLFNDWYGREAGDFVLAKIGSLLTNHEVVDGWLSGYLGQDDFCIIMPFAEDDILALFADISNVIAEYGTSLSFTPVFGICATDGTDAVLDLFDRSKLAAKAAKDDFKHRISYFEPEMYRQTDAEYRLLSDFQQALVNREIFYELQPQCRLSTSQVIGAEALARWKTADGKVVQPGDFVPVLEKHGFITDLDCFIWEEVCKQLRAWMDSGRTLVPISVNVSRQDAYALDVADYFEHLVSKYNLPVSAIKVEITESAYAEDTDRIDETAKRLREKGFLVLIDDFGSGYSSLNMLDSMNVDIVKLDLRFLRMNEKDKKKSVRILESTISMAKALGLVVITEGVETKEQADFLSSIGCRYVQGFYLYRPMSCEDFEVLIADESRVDLSGFQVKPNDEFHVREFLDQNVISDAMLNNLLGAIGIYSWHGDEVDIVRFNEQFYEEVGIEHLENYLKGNQGYVDKKDTDRYFDLLHDAMENELGGATDLIRFRWIDGTPLDILLHFYYIGETDGCKRFYGAIRNVTQVTRMRDELRLMSRIANVSVAFLRCRKGKWKLNVGIHGLRNELGISPFQLEDELEDRSFFDRLDEEAGARLRTLSYAPDDSLGDFTMPLDIKLDDGSIAKTTLSCYCLPDEWSVFSYVLVLQMA